MPLSPSLRSASTRPRRPRDRKSTRLNSSHRYISYSLLFFNDTAPTEIYPLSLHDALPICPDHRPSVDGECRSVPRFVRLPLALAGPDLLQPILHLHQAARLALVDRLFVVVAMKDLDGERDFSSELALPGRTDDGSIGLDFVERSSVLLRQDPLGDFLQVVVYVSAQVAAGLRWMGALRMDSAQNQLVPHGSGAGNLEPAPLPEGIEADPPLSHDVAEFLYSHRVSSCLWSFESSLL